MDLNKIAQDMVEVMRVISGVVKDIITNRGTTKIEMVFGFQFTNGQKWLTHVPTDHIFRILAAISEMMYEDIKKLALEKFLPPDLKLVEVQLKKDGSFGSMNIIFDGGSKGEDGKIIFHDCSDSDSPSPDMPN